MTWVIENSKQNGLGFVTLLMIANHSNAEGRKAFPSMKTLAKECRTSLRSVQRTILKLERSGELSVDRSSGRVSHSYSLPLMPNVDTETTLPKRQPRQAGHVKTVERGHWVATLQHGHPDHVDSQRGHPRSANVDTVGLNVDIAVSTDPLEPSLEPKEISAFAVLMKHHADRVGKILDGGKQGKAIKSILAAGFSPDDAIACYQWTVGWADAPDWSLVQGKIGSWLSKRNGNGAEKRMSPAERKAWETEQKRIHGWPESDEQRTA